MIEGTVAQQLSSVLIAAELEPLDRFDATSSVNGGGVPPDTHHNASWRLGSRRPRAEVASWGLAATPPVP